MRIDFKRIDIHNFMAFEDESFDFSAFKGMNLVQGKNNDIPNARNGSGKSTLFASLLYALFGQLQSKIKNENLVNKYNNAKDMDVSLLVAVDNALWRIRRGIKGKSSYLTLLSVDKDGNEKDSTRSTIAETQSTIEDDILHCDITMFLRTILLTSDQTYNFYMLKKADKKEFVEKMFDISVFEEMFKAMHKDVLALDKENAVCQSKLLMLNKNNDDYKSRSEQYESDHEMKISSLESDVKKLEVDVEDAKKNLVKPNEEAIQKIRESMSENEKSQVDIKAKIRNAQSDMNSIILDIHKLDESKSAKMSIVNKHKDILGKLCKDCQNVFIKHYSIDKIANDIKAIDAKRKELDSSREAFSKEIEESNKKLEDVNSLIESNSLKIKELSEKSNAANRALMQLESKLNMSRKDLEREKNAKNPYADLLEKCKADLLDEESHAAKIDLKSRYLKFAENIVSQDTIRKFIIKDLVVLLNNRIKTYLTRLGAKYAVKFDEDMDYKFLTSNGEFEWSNFSAGERMRIMIATSFAFRDFMSIRNGLNANILVLDEYFDTAIDALCLESIIGILKEYSSKQNQNIFVISHRPEVAVDQFDKVICIEKTNNISHICT